MFSAFTIFRGVQRVRLERASLLLSLRHFSISDEQSKDKQIKFLEEFMKKKSIQGYFELCINLLQIARLVQSILSRVKK